MKIKLGVFKQSGETFDFEEEETMKRILCLILSLLAFVVLLAACDEGKTPDDEDNGRSPEHTHAFGEWTVETVATCVAEGKEKRSCTCGEIEKRAIAATGEHIYADGVCSLCHQTKDQARLTSMTLKFENVYGKLYFDEKDGTVGYWNAKTNEIAFTNPTLEESVAADGYTAEQLMAHVLFNYVEGENEYEANTYQNGVLTKQEISVQTTQSGIQVNYALSSQRNFLVPVMIEASAFEEKILDPLYKLKEENPDNEEIVRAYYRLTAYYNRYDYIGMLESGDTERAEAIAIMFPITKEKGINIYVIDSSITKKELERLEGYIKAYCPAYTFEELEKDYAFVEYAEKLNPTFRTALTFTISENGLTVDFAEKCVWGPSQNVYYLPENGINCNENDYQVLQVDVLPYLKSLGLDCVTVVSP